MSYDPRKYVRAKKQPEDVSGNPSTVERKNRKVPWQNEWLHLPEFKDWLMKHPTDDQKAICKYCKNPDGTNRELHFQKKSDLLSHCNRGLHQKAVQKAIENETFEVIEFEELPITIKQRTKRLDLITAHFVAESNVAVRFTDFLVPFVKRLSEDPVAVEKMSLRQHKCKYLIINVIEPVYMRRLIITLNSVPFSVMVDESTDVSLAKILCVSVQYFYEKDEEIKVHLLTLLHLNSLNATAEGILEAFYKFLCGKSITAENVSGISSDNVSVFVGPLNGFTKQFKEKYNPNVISLPCICHLIALVAKEAMKVLPTGPLELVRGVVTFIGNSSKRCESFFEFLDLFQMPNRKPMKLSGTRWLEAQRCFARLVEQRSAIQSFFYMEVYDRTDIDEYDLEDSVVKKTSDAEKIHDLCQSDDTIAYCYFLADFLEEFNKFNAFFQGRNSLLNYKIFPMVCSFIHTVSFLFIKHDVVMNTPVDRIDLSQSCLPPSEIRLGSGCQNFLDKLEDRTNAALVEVSVREHISKYYRKVFEDFLRRFITENKNLKLWRLVQFVNQKFALYTEDRMLLPPFTCLKDSYQIYSDLDYTSLNSEWNDLPTCFTEEEKQALMELDVVKFWSKVFKIKLAVADTIRFPTLKRLVLIFFSLPHSNAEPERQFSDVKNKKGPKSSLTGDDLLHARCFILSYGRAYNLNFSNFEPSNEHFQLFNSENMYPQKKAADA